jgi:meiotic recombination protein SPO11
MSTTSEQIQKRINEAMEEIMTKLYSDPPQIPILSGKNLGHLSQARNFTSILLVMSYIQKLKPPHKTSTNREVYYYFITHFRSQNECDAAILDTCRILNCDRISLGLSASPKGWYACCFCRIHIREDNAISKVIDFDSGSMVHGLPITREWIDRASILSDVLDHGRNINTLPFSIHSDAKCILVIEKEGIYTRLVEDRSQLPFPTILVTGKGFSDIGTRALVFVLHRLLNIRVYGLCDCNPFGLAVLKTYYKGSTNSKRGETLEGGLRYSVPIKWLGLRPSHIETFLNEKVSIPKECFQTLTDLDRKKIASLMKDDDMVRDRGENDSVTIDDGQDMRVADHRDHGHTGFMNENRKQELELMQKFGWKVELESLNWLGMDFIGEWVGGLLTANEEEYYNKDSLDDDFVDLRLAI